MLTGFMRTIASSLQTPVIAILLLLTVIAIVIIGTLIAEIFTERKCFKVQLSKLVDELQQTDGTDVVAAIEGSGLLRRQKDALLELLKHPEVEDETRESLAVNLVFNEKAHFSNRIKITDTMAKVSPMMGIMGTLIPLGPGLMALGQGDTAALSESLLTAFDTTVMGMVIAAIALIISAIRKSWYARYMSAFETAVECVLDIAKDHRSFDMNGAGQND